MSRLDEIQARLAAASKGPWYSSDDGYEVGRKPNGNEIVWLMDHEGGGVAESEDCEFIAHSREDVPWLIDEINRLKDQYAFAVGQCATFTEKLRKAKLIDEAFAIRWKNEWRKMSEEGYEEEAPL